MLIAVIKAAARSPKLRERAIAGGAVGVSNRLLVAGTAWLVEGRGIGVSKVSPAAAHRRAEDAARPSLDKRARVNHARAFVLTSPDSRSRESRAFKWMEKMKFETIAFGYGLIEGPRVDERGRLYFSDVTNGGVYRRSLDGSVETLIPKRRGIGGMAFNEGNGLVLTGRGLIHWSERTGQSRDLFTRWAGRDLRGLNDLTVDAQGSVYTGTLEFDAVGGGPPVPGNLFRIDPPANPVLLWEGILLTNGLAFSPDGRLLYHCDSVTNAVWVYDVTPERTVRDRRVFARVPEGWPDGMAADVEGALWVAVYGGGEIIRVRADGTIDRRVKMPAKMVTTLVFGGADLSELYVASADNLEDPTRGGTIFRAHADVPGAPVPKARF
jgi:gluconolactonase